MKRAYVAAITRSSAEGEGGRTGCHPEHCGAVKMKGLTGAFPRQITAVAHKANRLTFVSICNDF